jgi:tripartite-type tricarboxylate transporter receptor subunit TctC
MRRRPFLGLAAQALAFPAIALAQDRGGSGLSAAPPGGARYPDRPIRVIVPFPPGGGTDVWARMVAEGLQAELGQTILIENRAGAGGLVGAEVAAKAVPDGYTLLYNITTHVQAPVTFRRFPYDPVADFFPVGRLGTTAITFCVGPSVPASITTLAEFVAWGRGRDLSLRQLRPGLHRPCLCPAAGRGGGAEGDAGGLSAR